jgi:hypothetical protein
MLSLRLETMTRFIGWVLLISVGILIALLVMIVVGGAVPIGTWTLNPNSLRGSATYLTFFDPQNATNGLYFDYSPARRAAAVLYTTEWHTLPIETGLLIPAGVVAVLGIVCLWLRRTLRDMSEEAFP